SCQHDRRQRLSYVAVLVVAILFRNVVFRNFARVDFGNIGRWHVLDTLDGLGLEVVTFFMQFRDALGICVGNVRETLKVAGLSGGIGTKFVAMIFRHVSLLAMRCADRPWSELFSRVEVVIRGIAAPGLLTLVRRVTTGRRCHTVFGVEA